jgi:FAD/FMN-containing dehydrogenase
VAPIYNTRFDGVVPDRVARPIDAKDVQAAVQWCVANNSPTRARSGGHSYAGYSTLSGGTVLDLRQHVSGISFNKQAGTATIGAGAQLIDVYAALSAHGVTIPSGSCPSVGIAGVTLGGGMGLAGRNFGLTLDNVKSIQIVTADGKLQTVDSKNNPNDLFWALRGGGGGNFGVVTAFTFNVHKVPSSVAYFNVRWPLSSASAAIDAWQSWGPHTTDKITSVFHLDASTAGSSASVNANGQYFGPSSDLPHLLARLLSVSGASLYSVDLGYMQMRMLDAGCSMIPFNACHTVGASPGGTLPREKFWAKSDYVGKPIPAAGRNALISAAEHRGGSGSGAILFDCYGGKINTVPSGATAFVHRNVLFAIQYLTYDSNFDWLNSTYQVMRPYVTGGAYQNYIDAGQKNWQSAYYGSNYSRLVKVQKAVDPHHFFNFPQAIGR